MSDLSTITIHEAGATTIQDMKRQALAVEEAWKSSRPEYGTQALRSLAHNLAELFSRFFGQETKVFRDDELSLYVTTSTIVFGVIFHGTHRSVKGPEAGDPDMGYGAPRAGRYCMSAEGDGKYCGKPYTWQGGHVDDGGIPTCEGHSPFPVTMPIPGEWSFHS